MLMTAVLILRCNCYHYLVTDVNHDEGRFRGTSGWLVSVGAAGLVTEVVILFISFISLDSFLSNPYFGILVSIIKINYILLNVNNYICIHAYIICDRPRENRLSLHLGMIVKIPILKVVISITSFCLC